MPAIDRRKFLTWMGGSGFATRFLSRFLSSPILPKPQKPIHFYVSPSGNDTWSGQLANPNDSQSDGPFATLEQAQTAIRQLKQLQGLTYPVTVWVRGGTYFLDTPLTFTPEDSGTAKCPITWRAYTGETPVISGGRLVTGWQSVELDGRSLQRAQIPEVANGEWQFRQLWVDDRRASRARYPNRGLVTIAGLPDVTPDTSGDDGQNRFEFRPGEIRAWENLTDVEVVLLHTWVSVRLPVARVDETQNLVTFTRSTRRRMTETKGTQQPARYYVENALELLDTPGEWYLNRQTGELYYWPRSGEEMAEIPVVAPALRQMLRLEGRPETGTFVEFLHFRGLTFSHTTWDLAGSDGGDSQAASWLLGAVAAEGARHCIWEDCTIAHTGEYGLDLSRGCHHNQILRCRGFDLGAGGIKLGERTIRNRNWEQTYDNAIAACELYRGGRVFHHAVGIWVGESFENRIADNHIYDFGYTGISVGWSWRYDPTVARGNIIEGNHVHHIGWLTPDEPPILNDLGAIYILGPQPGTTIRNNLCHDIGGLVYGGRGIYLDQGSSEILVTNNLVYRTTHESFFLNFGKENIVRNNIFALGERVQLGRERQEEHISVRFERNIIYWQNGRLTNTRWGDSGFIFDFNLYGTAREDGVKLGDLSWSEWQETGMDLHSAIADPLFVDPENGDFRLKPDSPAFALGFKPLSRYSGE